MGLNKMCTHTIHRATYRQINNKAVQSRKTCIRRSAIKSAKRNCIANAPDGEF